MIWKTIEVTLKSKSEGNKLVGIHSANLCIPYVLYVQQKKASPHEKDDHASEEILHWIFPTNLADQTEICPYEEPCQGNKI
ncbi:hypothetical protein CEXT_206481 [Caerostris extrusa]|uniref:Uncharacterized protein n=1 Tax=Caerostris extrusa TaxID=172846 RepID=A0AAV4SXD7_CAEEX|nr:hypothetical protein CEXT_206481 [Caerostris extrusa]